ncbi:phosphatidate cytidylyltransferase [Serratia microhaemolytica]|uniref:phosphatidate cytidylyltransferase n=1 Tax=Serratia microhaemolytica TaxID=2675110 RepID=UPI000FDE93C9|nr:phosphatidate cytidylyltransferase [Serratia microhaemolytica]
MLKSRIITALLLIPVVIAALFFLSPLGFTLVTLTVCLLAAWEWGPLAGFTARAERIWVAIIFGALLVLTLFGVPLHHPSTHYLQIAFSLWISLFWWSAALVLVLLYPTSATLWRYSHVLRLIFGLLTIMPFFWGMLTLRQINYDQNPFTGAWWLLYVMLLVWAADSGAYTFGKLFGKHKLAPKVSPAKTWEGLVGGIITSAAISAVFGYFAPLQIAPLTLLICSVVAVLASALGDLTESMFKREAGIKDSGNLIPGHGGILDRIDSLTAAIPVFACLLLLVF